MSNNLEQFFYPKSICIVGASSKPKSIGYEILKSINSYSFTGVVLPVNPKADNILGYKSFHSISEIEDEIDLAIIVVPKKFVEDSIDELIKKGVKSVILITAGFRETGIEGKKREEELLNKLRENNVRMVGPNCMGLINTLEETKLNATFVAERPERGGIGFLSQSGALGAAVLNSLRDTDIRFAHFISIGNKADISELDVMDFWLSDLNIKTLAFYLESFENGIEFIRKYIDKKLSKPLLILKAGKTESGMIAASSHTGALSSNEKITASLLKQFGIIRVNNINEMFNTAKGYEHFPKPSGNRVAVITNAGGPAILAVDKLEERNLALAQFSESTREKLREIVHPEGSINNPVDLLPGGSPEVFKLVNEIVLEDENVDSVLSIFVEPVMVDAFEVIESVNSIESMKPIYQVCMPLPEFWKNYLSNSITKTPIFRNPEDPAEVISNILLYEMKKNHDFDFQQLETNQIGDNSKATFLDQGEVEYLCKKFKIPVIESRTIPVNDIDNQNDLAFPVVVKGLNENVIHKSELSAVKLNIKNKDELVSAVNEISKSFSAHGFNLEEILVQPYINVKHELLIGGFRDPSFGPVVMFGSGGKYVEIIDDTQIRSAVLDDTVIEEMISDTKIGQILHGVRGEASANIADLKKIIDSISKMMIENKNILEIDLNPLVVDTNHNYYAVDIRIKSS